LASEDIRDFLTALSAAGAEFLVVGAHALASHGYVRATADLDVFVRASPENARKVELAIRDFAAVSLEYFGVSAADLSVEGVGFYMGVEPDRIDVITDLAGVRFDRAWRGRIESAIEGVPVAVLGLADLITAKRASARKRSPGSPKAKLDEADLAWLIAERDRRKRDGE
jgi:hypothetical protein